MSFSCQKGEFDQFFNRLDRPVEESRPDRQPDRFPSLVRTPCVSIALSTRPLIGFDAICKETRPKALAMYYVVTAISFSFRNIDTITSAEL